MGYNTVAVILNDQLDRGANDPNLGKHILDAARGWLDGRHDRLAAHIVGSYGQVISQDHADSFQVVVVHGNCGWRIDEAEYDGLLAWQAFDAMQKCLERNGYKVTKPRKVKAVVKAKADVT